MQLVKIVYGNDDPTTATQVTQGLLQQYPNLKGIISPTTVGIAAAAAVLDTAKYRGKIQLTGLGTPDSMKKYVKDGTVQAFELWNPANLGYLAAYAASSSPRRRSRTRRGSRSPPGKLGKFTVGAGHTILLGAPYVFNKANIYELQLLGRFRSRGGVSDRRLPGDGAPNARRSRTGGRLSTLSTSRRCGDASWHLSRLTRRGTSGAPPARCSRSEHATKSFGAIRALEDVSIDLYAGEAHALVGENGAGKSTLVKIFAGVHTPDSGPAARSTASRSLLSGPAAARDAGIAVIYQEPTLFPDLTVVENIFIGRQPLRGGRRIDRRAMHAQAEAIFERLGVRLDPDRIARGLSIAEQQLVEIAQGALARCAGDRDGRADRRALGRRGRAPLPGRGRRCASPGSPCSSSRTGSRRSSRSASA